MALKLLPILQVIVILGLPQIFAYPVYGTKRYGRGSSSNRPVSAGWPMPVNYQQLPRSQRYPVNYYEMYPYGQNYPDDYYYPQDSLSYPVYYPARTSKYEVYQAVLPYYYTETPVPRLRYGYYGYGGSKDPLVDLEEEVLEEEREEREEAQPVGHEMYYENQDQDSGKDDSFDDVNAAFLQNLIMTEMYKNAVNKQNQNLYKGYGPELDLSTEDSYGKWEDYPAEPHPKYYQEDEDVRELKQLSSARYQKEKPAKPSTEDRLNLFQPANDRKQNKKTMNKNDYYWNNSENKRGLAPKRSLAQKQVVAATTASTSAPSTTTAPVKVDTRGQKEEVLMRPATPVRHPFSDLNMLIEGERKRTPSVYDTIKHMLEMEKNLDKVSSLFFILNFFV